MTLIPYIPFHLSCNLYITNKLQHNYVSINYIKTFIRPNLNSFKMNYLKLFYLTYYFIITVFINDKLLLGFILGRVPYESDCI